MLRINLKRVSIYTLSNPLQNKKDIQSITAHWDAHTVLTLTSSLLMGTAIYMLFRNFWASVVATLSVVAGIRSIANVITACTKMLSLKIDKLVEQKEK